MFAGFQTLKSKAESSAPLSKDEAYEKAQQSYESAKQSASTNATIAKEKAKENLSYAAQKSKEAAGTAKEYAGSAWNPVKAKLDETGATAVASQGYNMAAEKGKMAAAAVNAKVDANPNLKYAKDVTSEKLGYAATVAKSSLFSMGSWLGVTAPVQEGEGQENEEESKDQSLEQDNDGET